jgi:hypothetical protein
MADSRERAISNYIETMPEGTFGEVRSPGRAPAWKRLRAMLEKATEDDPDLLFATGKDGPALLTIRRNSCRLVVVSLEPDLRLDTLLVSDVGSLRIRIHRGLEDSWGESEHRLIEVESLDLPGAPLRIQSPSQEAFDALAERLQAMFAS